MGESLILDEGNDQLVLFGGGGNDVWGLPLSGQHAYVWTELHPEGKYPPVHRYGSTLFTDSAVYDPTRGRMLLLLNPVPSTAGESSEIQLWELSLAGTPRWTELKPSGPTPGSEIQSGHLALDTAGHRLFAAGGADEKSGVWALSLRTMTWSRVADMPLPNSFYTRSSLWFDDATGHLILSAGAPPQASIWSLSPETGAWSTLASDWPSTSHGMTAVLDSARNRLVIVGNEGGDPGATFSLDSKEWSPFPNANPGSSAVLDAKRGRVLAFGAVASGAEGANAVSAISLDDLQVTTLVEPTRSRFSLLGGAATVWDPERIGVIAYGDYRSPGTWFHGLGADDEWLPLASVGETPGLSNTPAVYDGPTRSIVSFGGYAFGESRRLVRLSSEPGSKWEGLMLANSPGDRSAHLGVLDEANHRFIVYGGIRNSSYPPSLLDDCWSLSLDGSPVWSRIETRGASPGARSDLNGVYDPVGQRLLAFGDGDIHSLSLDVEPTWSLLEVPRTPAHISSVVYDSTRQRVIASSLAKMGGYQLFALELAGTPAWHKFCPTGITPAALFDTLWEQRPVLVPDGLFLDISGGSFKFDLETPYCNE